MTVISSQNPIRVLSAVPASSLESGAGGLVAAGRGLVVALVGWFERTVATEHFCDPPGAVGQQWVIAKADQTAAGLTPAYCCPECGERWIGAGSR